LARLWARVSRLVCCAFIPEAAVLIVLNMTCPFGAVRARRWAAR
jgi:hypothetical protein